MKVYFGSIKILELNIITILLYRKNYRKFPTKIMFLLYSIKIFSSGFLLRLPNIHQIAGFILTLLPSPNDFHCAHIILHAFTSDTLPSCCSSYFYDTHSSVDILNTFLRAHISQGMAFL